jgi:hypothetical protein
MPAGCPLVVVADSAESFEIGLEGGAGIGNGVGIGVVIGVGNEVGVLDGAGFANELVIAVGVIVGSDLSIGIAIELGMVVGIDAAGDTGAGEAGTVVISGTVKTGARATFAGEAKTGGVAEDETDGGGAKN